MTGNSSELTSAELIAHAISGWVLASLSEANDFAREGLPALDIQTLFQDLARSTEFEQESFSIALVGFGLDRADLQRRAEDAGLDKLGGLDTDLHVATEWRNNRAEHPRIIALASGYNPSVHGLKFFAKAKSSDLASHLLEWAGKQRAFRATPRHGELLAVLSSSPELEGLRSLEVTAEFLKRWHDAAKANAADAPRVALSAFGILPDPHLFEEEDFIGSIQKNLQITEQLKLLSPREIRQRRKRAERYRDSERRAAMTEILDRLDAFRRSGSQAALTLSDAEKILRPPVDVEPQSSEPSTDEDQDADRGNAGDANDVRSQAADALIDGREEDLTRIADGLSEAWEAFDEGGGDRLVASVTTSTGTFTIEELVDTKVLEWVTSFCTPDHWGGWFEAPNLDLRQALNRASEFEPIFINPAQALRLDGVIRSVEELLIGWDQSDAVKNSGKRPLADTWRSFVSLRTELAGSVRQLLAHPREWLDGKPELRRTCAEYLNVATELYGRVQEHYRDVSEESADWAQATLEILLSLDIVQVKITQSDGGASHKAVMLPLHPLHLWRYQRLSEILRNLASNIELADTDRKAIVRELKSPEHFLSVLRLGGAPEGRGHNQLLPVANDIDGLATFENLHNALSSADGIETLIRTLDYYVLLHPNHPFPLRVAVINPPEPVKLLEQVVKLLDEKRYRSGGRLPVIRIELLATKSHVDRLKAAAALDDRVQDLIYEKVSAGRLEVLIRDETTQHDLQEIVKSDLSKKSFHVVAIFDEATVRLRRRRLERILPMSPFCVRNDIRVDTRLSQIRLEPQAGSPPFSDFMMMIGELDQEQRDSMMVTAADAEALRETIDCLLQGDNPSARWVCLADRALPGEAGMQSVRLLERKDGRRNVLVCAADYGRLAGLMYAAFNNCNLTITQDKLSEVIRQGVNLAGSGLLEMVKKQDGLPEGAKVLGFAGTLLAARDLLRRYPNSLVVSVDHPIARLWLRLGERQGNERCDLLVVQRLGERQFKIVCAEVKTTERTELSDDDARIEHASTQISRTLAAIRDALIDADRSGPLNAPRSEMLKEVLVRGASVSLSGDVSDAERRRRWGPWLRELFAQDGVRPSISIEGEITAVLLRSNENPSIRAISGKGFPLSMRTITEPLAEELFGTSPLFTYSDEQSNSEEQPSGSTAISAVGSDQVDRPGRFGTPTAIELQLPTTEPSERAADQPSRLTGSQVGHATAEDFGSADARVEVPSAKIELGGPEPRGSSSMVVANDAPKTDHWPPPVNALGLIGQDQVARELVNQAAKARGWSERFGDKLLVGPAGVGKSTLARRIGENLLSLQTILFNGADLRRPEMIIERLIEAGRVPESSTGVLTIAPCLLFIDEVHAISATVATALLSALDDRRTTTVGNIVYSFENVVFLLATTDPGRLTEAFLSRPDRTYLRPYTLDELAGIVWLHAREMLEGAELSRETCLEIAARMRGNPRPAVNILKPMVASFYTQAEDDLGRVPSRANVAARITQEAVAAWFDAQEVDANGLDTLAREFLNVLRRRGAVSEDELRRALGISNRGDFVDYNEYLTRLGLVTIGPGGRTLTPDGRRYLSSTAVPDLRDRIARRTA